MEKLKPCPFCGHKASLWEGMSSANGCKAYAVWCNNNGCYVDTSTLQFNTAKAAIKCWNKRWKK